MWNWKSQSFSCQFLSLGRFIFVDFIRTQSSFSFAIYIWHSISCTTSWTNRFCTENRVTSWYFCRLCTNFSLGRHCFLAYILKKYTCISSFFYFWLPPLALRFHTRQFWWIKWRWLLETSMVVISGKPELVQDLFPISLFLLLIGWSINLDQGLANFFHSRVRCHVYDGLTGHAYHNS